MKDRKFLEQLNLYLDGEIDPADAAEFEQEILSNPSRRRIYHDYCRIHRATKLVGEQFRAAGAAMETDVLPPARPIAAGEHQAQPIDLGGRSGGRAAPRPFRRLGFATGLAAACALGLFIGTRALAPVAQETPAAPPAVVHIEPAAPAQVVAAAPVEKPAATFPAPFAPETRQDPFVQHTPSRGDPFVLTPWTVADAVASPTVPAITNPPVLRIDPRFQPAGLDQRTETEEQRENLTFRLHLNAQPVSATPPGLGAQP